MFLVYVACFVSVFQSHVGRQASHQTDKHLTFNTWQLYQGELDQIDTNYWQTPQQEHPYNRSDSHQLLTDTPTSNTHITDQIDTNYWQTPQQVTPT